MAKTFGRLALRLRILVGFAGAAGLIRPAGAETYLVPPPGLDALLSSSREEALARLGRPVPDGAPAPELGYFVEYAHLNLVYRIGPFLNLSGAEGARQKLLRARGARLERDPEKYRFSEVRIFHINAGETTRSTATQGAGTTREGKK